MSIDPSKRGRGRNAPSRDRDDRAERSRELHTTQSLSTTEAEGRTSHERKGNIGPETLRELEKTVATESRVTQQRESEERRGRVRAPASHPGSRGNAFGQVKCRAALDTRRVPPETRRAEHEVVGPARNRRNRGCGSRAAGTRSASTSGVRAGVRFLGQRRDVLDPHGQREAARARSNLERVGERDRLIEGRDLVVSVGAPGPHDQPQVELGARFHEDTAHGCSASPHHDR